MRAVNGSMHPAFLVIGSLVMGGLVLAWRVRESTRPVTLPKIVIPPLGMSTGLLMFLYPPTRIPWSWALAAFGLGAALFALPVIRTSQLMRVGDAIVMRRSKAFLWVLLGLFAVRTLARNYTEALLDPLQTGSVFFLLAFGMVLRWRLQMLSQYRALTRVTTP